MHPTPSTPSTGLANQRVTIGDLEALAGIDPDPESRAAFWKPFARLPGDAGLVAGAAELRRRIAERVAAGILCLTA